MANYKPNPSVRVKCSCVICKIETTTNQLDQHHHSHQHVFPKEPKYFGNCKNCRRELRGYSKTTFCSRSCNCSFGNLQRSKHGPPKGYSFNGRNLRKDYLPYSKIFKCVVCEKLHNKNRKTCSDECKRTLLSNNMIERIKKTNRSNYRRDKQSFLEKSFEDWLISNNISNYVTEKTIKNHLTNKWYFVDFYFPDYSLIIELDGKQHEKQKHKEKDIDRDDYLTSIGYKVVRISHSEYIQKTKYNLISSLLGLVRLDGTAPSFSG